MRLPLLWLGLLATVFTWSTQALKVHNSGRPYTNWTHIAEFVFETQGSLSGTVASTFGSRSYLVVFDDLVWQELRSNVDPYISTCKLLSLAMYSEQLGVEPTRVSFTASKFSKYHIFVINIASMGKCSETMLLLRQWRSAKRRGPIKVFHRLFSNRFDPWHNAPAVVPKEESSFVSYDLHLVNVPLGTLMEFSSEEILVLPIITVFLLVFSLLIRFQLASTRLLWANTGVSIASALLMIFVIKWASLLFTWFGLIFFACHGFEVHSGPYDYKWGSLLLDGVFSLGTLIVLIATSKGWMITTPSIFADAWTKLQFTVLVINAFASVTSLARFLFPMTENHSSILSDLVIGTSHLYVFVSSYADLVNLMRRSRMHVGAKPRARAFNAVAALLLIWAVTPIIQVGSSHLFAFWLEPMVITLCTLGLQAFSSVLLAWAFRPELLWELHGERPHAGAAGKLYFGSSSNGMTKNLKRFDDSVDELDGLLAV